MKKSIAGIAALSFFLLLAGTLVVIAIVGSGGSFEPPPLPDVAEVGTSGVADTPEPAAEADPVSLGEVAENAADPAYPPDRIARVRVVDPEGRPLSGVRVELLLEMKTLGDDAHAKVGAEAVSDEAGRVDFDVDPLTRYQLRASHPDFAIVGDVNCFGGNVTALCLPKGGRIAGTVTDAETGKPLPGADVYAMDWSNVGIVAEWRATTDEEGRYRIEGVGPGALNMNARAPDRPVTYPTKGVRVTAGEETVVDFALPLGRRVALRVVNAESGVAIPEVTLEHGERADIVGSGERIETWPLPPDGSALRVAAEGFVPLTLYLMDPGQEKEAFREVRLSQASVVTGIVRKASGEVAPGVDVRLTVRGPSPYTFFALDTVTAADGTFRVSGASPGGDIHWELFRNGTAFQFGPWQAVPETPGELRLEPIVIEETATVHGRVLDPVGVPITWGYLKVRRPEDQGVPARSMAFLDPRGRFLLRDVPEGRVELWVTIQGGWPTQLLKLEVNADMEFDVQLERGFEIGGRVVDPQGRPLAGRWLGLEQQNPITKTDDEGRFLLRGLGPGPHSIYIGDAGLPAAEGIRGNTFDVEIIED